jgi:hypothetical protein
MEISDELDLPCLLKHVQQQQRHPRFPQPISEAVNRLMARHGIANEQERAIWDQALVAAAGDRLAKACRAGRFQRGVLEVVVRNSAALQELTFQRRQILNKLVQALPHFRIRDVRFRIGDLGR